MKFFLATALILTSLTLGTSAYACAGANIQLNPSTWLKADGIYGDKGLEQSAEAMETTIKQGKRAVFNISDKGIETHLVEFLGSIKDEGGVIQAIYIVKDSKTATEKTIIVKSNYRGNGIFSKGIGSEADSRLKDRRGFSSLQEAGCR